MTVHLVTFSDESMSRSRELCIESALRHGASKIHRWVSPGSKERGCGYWRWKPKIILNLLTGSEALDLPLDGDIVIYSDAGVEFINNVNYIIDRMDQDIFLFGNNWEHAHWCKRDVVDAVRPYWTEKLEVTKESLDSPSPWGPKYRRIDWDDFGKQCQASVIFFRVSDYSRKFVAEWLHWCLFEGGRLIDDSPSRAPNHPEFQENRHDQAILTTLAYREGIKLHWWPSVYNKGGSPEFVYEKLSEYAGDDYPVLFSHHRKRNYEWGSAA